ncbi:hypothetical protein [Streptomyces fulvoviolaceus]|uniref:hypothetical protein n=1 Tax=Streptomyces fulvoviolaceus TaxID=285535 RepID=UPI0004C66936|nr:hypothetical protein [Streptomyces fulvoviolaceus]
MERSGAGDAREHAPARPAYGDPQQHPSSPDAPGTPYYYPAVPEEESEPWRRSGRSTAALVAVALVVAVGAGATVHTVLKGGDPVEPVAGVIPVGYLGDWATADGANTRRLTIRQGEVGDPVLTMVADGTTQHSTYHCVFEAVLLKAPVGKGPLTVGPSMVTTGASDPSCSPGGTTAIRLLPDGSLEQAKLHFTRPASS